MCARSGAQSCVQSSVSTVALGLPPSTPTSASLQELLNFSTLAFVAQVLSALNVLPRAGIV